MAHKENTLNAYHFCGEHARELPSGRITFSKKTIDKFIQEYTHLLPGDFTKDMRERLVSFVMIPMYNTDIQSIVKNNDPKEKIDLPDAIFK